MTVTWFPQGVVDANPGDEPHATTATAGGPAICGPWCTAGCDTVCSPFGTVPVPQWYPYQWTDPQRPVQRATTIDDPYAGGWS